MSRRLQLTGLGLLLCFTRALALPEDSEQPLDIDAVSSELLIDEDLMFYEGTAENPVVVSQGSLTVQGLQMEGRGVVERDNPVMLVMKGEPARFQVQPRADSDLVLGSASRLIYQQTGNVFTLQDDARLEMGDRMVTAVRIEYRSDEAATSATGDENVRVYMEVPSADGTVIARADETVYEEASGLLTATGSEAEQVYIEAPTPDGAVIGYADKATYEEPTGIITLEGNSCMEVKGTVVRGHSATYNTVTRAASISGQGDSDLINITDRPGSCR